MTNSQIEIVARHFDNRSVARAQGARGGRGRHVMPKPESELARRVALEIDCSQKSVLRVLRGEPCSALVRYAVTAALIKVRAPT